MPSSCLIFDYKVQAAASTSLHFQLTWDVFCRNGIRMQHNDVELDTMVAESDEADVNQPLIPDHEHSRSATDHGQHDDQHEQQPLGTQTTLRNAGKAVWLLTLSAGVSGLLFGYDTGVVSSMLVSIDDDLGGHPMSTAEKSWVTAVTSLSALLFAPLTGIFADRYGRRSVILFADLLFVLGAGIQASASIVSVMVVGRAVIGAAIGLASCATPLYITELAPAEIRGRLVTIQSLFITGGQVLAYLLGWLLAPQTSGWRWMVGLGLFPAVFQLFMLAFMPETPRWLVKAGRQAIARGVLQKVYSGVDESRRQIIVESTLVDIETELAQQSKLSHNAEIATTTSMVGPTIFDTAHQLFSIPGNRRALIIACMLHGLQQICGFNALMYFSATIFALVGFTSPIATSMSVALTNFLFTILAFRYIDTVGRRKILLRSVPFMVIGLAICSIAFRFINLGSNTAPSIPSDRPEATTTGWPMVLLGSVILYVAAYAVGLGCVPWQQSELFPLPVRSLGSGIATAANWSSNFIIGSTFLPLIEFLGASWTFLIYSSICLVGWFCIWRIYPETAGLQLEGVGELLRTGWGVKESIERFQARKRPP